jgi:hypothetical protein
MVMAVVVMPTMTVIVSGVVIVIVRMGLAQLAAPG